MPSHPTDLPLSHPPQLDALFDARAAAHPDRPALHVEERVISYAALAARKAGVRDALLDAGLFDAHRSIGLLCAKAADAYAAMLAIMASGNVYVPLNPGHPPERIRKIVESARLSTFVVDAASFPAIAGWLVEVAADVTVFMLNASSDAAVAHPANVRLRAVRPADGAPVRPAAAHTCELAYLMFTSGSTGAPKGVPVKHANVLALLAGLRPVLALHGDDRLTHFAELSFDFSVGEIFPCWDAGACLYLPSQVDLLDPAAFVRRHGLTVWSSVPTLGAYVQQLAALSSGRMPTLRLALFCGEALPTGLARFWHDAAPDARIVNLYGPTEATVFATSYTFDPAAPPPGEWVPIGEPFDTVLARIDTAGEPDRPIGELLLAGPQVVERYWGEAGASGESAGRFVADPAIADRRWYRTGDLVSRSPHHGYVFHGRADHQVKVRGFRIELQEIEATLRRLLPDQQVAVVAARGGVGQEAELVAFCARLDIDRDELARRCALELPAYMVPHVVMALAPFPVNVNGKVDYLSLQRLAAAALAEPEAVPAPAR
ncbi:amino acid adenylation domain-containing protein [Burkholderia ubonensis]|uniref:AMP-dependent synthetase/ligase domain-containing protein n=1 Tax=Burkholderia ubonensis subsp. mesacidophila TaxID=265293 RepID=A0A2A4FAV4_9BURK|nr:amino acid adenylation domain-containing protein [Burkholderia ubonensis]PCE30147.1 hypothetical protein BZL54_22100 [Burkholderia ubonensis subsp. mesacidophila]